MFEDGSLLLGHFKVLKFNPKLYLKIKLEQKLKDSLSMSKNLFNFLLNLCEMSPGGLILMSFI